MTRTDPSSQDPPCCCSIVACSACLRLRSIHSHTLHLPPKRLARLASILPPAAAVRCTFAAAVRPCTPPALADRDDDFDAAAAAERFAVAAGAANWRPGFELMASLARSHSGRRNES